MHGNVKLCNAGPNCRTAAGNHGRKNRTRGKHTNKVPKTTKLETMKLPLNNPYRLPGPFDGWKSSCSVCSAALTVSFVLIGGGVGSFPTFRFAGRILRGGRSGSTSAGSAGATRSARK